MKLLMLLILLPTLSISAPFAPTDPENSEAIVYILRALTAYPAIKQIAKSIENRIPLSQKNKTVLGVAVKGSVDRELDTGKLIKTKFMGFKVTPTFRYDLDTQEARILVLMEKSF